MQRILTLTTAIALGTTMVVTEAEAQSVQDMQVDPTIYRDMEDMVIQLGDGERIGEIEEVLIDPSTKDIAVVVEVEEGFLDISDVEKVFPLSALELDQDVFIVDITRDDVAELTDYQDD